VVVALLAVGLFALYAVVAVRSAIYHTEDDMIDIETVARIRQLYYREHWRIGTIATELGLHHATVRHALGDRFRSVRQVRRSVLDPYVEFMQEILERHPRLRATRLWAMLTARGCPASIRQVRRKVATLRPKRQEAFLCRRTFPGEEGQVDWAGFGQVRVSGAKRTLSLFAMVLSYSRAVYLEFFLDQTLASFLRGHVRAFLALGGVPRVLLYDNLRSAVIERRDDAVRFNPRLLELAAHYHFLPRACRPGRGNEKGRVERTLRYVRDSFFAARSFTTIADFNRQAHEWRDTIAHQRRWVQDDSRTVSDALTEEQPRLLSLPAHPFDTDEIITVASRKTIYVRFDRNDYSIPPGAVGRSLTLVASDTRVRLFDKQTLIAQHRRSWGRHERVEDPVHVAALLAEKQRACGSVPATRLQAAVPESEAFLDAAFARGESVALLTRKLLLLLDDFGAAELRTAMAKAMATNSPRIASVAFLLNQRRRQTQRRLAPVDLSRRPDLADLYVTPHAPEVYDELTNTED
jgi:transposase